VGRGIMLNRLQPGAYRLGVQATNGESKTTTWRWVDFTIIDAEPLELNNRGTQEKKEVILPSTSN
jgi:hypothetical protein